MISKVCRFCESSILVPGCIISVEDSRKNRTMFICSCKLELYFYKETFDYEEFHIYKNYYAINFNNGGCQIQDKDNSLYGNLYWNDDNYIKDPEKALLLLSLL